MTSTQIKDLNVFFSWQSDSPRYSNSNAIREGLEKSKRILNEKYTDYNINIDEATRNEPGSPNISSTIFQKIERSDVFICDITTINANQENNRKTPNPNVLIELGFAISKLGWNRIIMLSNTLISSMEEVPFDIRNNRVSTYQVRTNDDKNGKNRLNSLITLAIDTIVEQNPKRPSEVGSKSDEDLKRENDLNQLNWLFSQINIIGIDGFLEDYPEMISYDSLFYWEGFNAVLASSFFHLYDQIILNKLKSFHVLWKKSLSYSEFYQSIPSTKMVGLDQNEATSAKEEDTTVYEKLTDLKLRLYIAFKDLISFVRENYIEIDLSKTSERAIQELNS